MRSSDGPPRRERGSDSGSLTEFGLHPPVSGLRVLIVNSRRDHSRGVLAWTNRPRPSKTGLNRPTWPFCVASSEPGGYGARTAIARKGDGPTSPTIESTRPPEGEPWHSQRLEAGDPIKHCERSSCPRSVVCLRGRTFVPERSFPNPLRNPAAVTDPNPRNQLTEGSLTFKTRWIPPKAGDTGRWAALRYSSVPKGVGGRS